MTGNDAASEARASAQKKRKSKPIPSTEEQKEAKKLEVHFNFLFASLSCRGCLLGEHLVLYLLSTASKGTVYLYEGIRNSAYYFYEDSSR